MKAFYIIHITVILETILAIFIAIRLSEFTLELKKLGVEIEKKSELNLAKIKKIREYFENFNIKCAQRFSYNFYFIKKIIVDLLVQGFIRKYLPKTNFLSKIGGYKTTIACFILTFFFFKKKNA